MTARFLNNDSLELWPSRQILVPLICWFVACLPVHAGLEIKDVVVGLDGHYRVGHFTQIRVDVQTDVPLEDVSLEVVLPDGEGVRSVSVTEGLALEAGSGHLETIVKFGRVSGDLEVRLVDPTGLALASKSISAAELPDAVLGSQDLVLTLGPDLGVAKVVATRHEKPDEETVHVQLPNPTSLPSRWLGYSGVRLVVLPTGESSAVAGMSQGQIDALQHWVRLGGRLILSSGANSDQTLGSGGPLASFVPGTYVRVQMQRQTSGIENYAGKTVKTLASYVADDELTFRIPTAVVKDIRGEIIVADGIGDERTATIIRSSYGFGHVIFVAVDLEQPPVSDWSDGRRKVLANLVDVALGKTQRDETDNQFSQLTQIGFVDITGQLRAALDQFADVKLVPFSWIAVLIALYILLIGPVDYFLLRNWNRRFRYTWLTFPLMVVGGCALAYVLVQFWKGHSLRINQVNLVDIDVTSGQLRQLTWGHVFSPQNRKYDLALQPANQIFSPREPMGRIVSWQGLPGRSFGGMNTSRISQSAEQYRILTDLQDVDNQSIRISGMPIDIYSSRSLSGLWWGQVELEAAGPLKADIDFQLTGEVRNPLPLALRECMLCYGRWVYPLASMPANGTALIDRMTQPKTLEGVLTRNQIDQDDKDRSQPWDRRSFDRERIMEIMMFHKAAGGKEYTSLLNRFQSEVDFTDHLTEGKALLVGKISESPVKLLEGQAPQHDTTTYVRILLPVEQQRIR